MSYRALACLTLTLLAMSSAVSAHSAHSHNTNVACENRIAPTCGQAPTPAFDRDGKLWWVWYQQDHIRVQQQGGHPRIVNPEPEVVDDQGEDRPQIAFGPDNQIYLLWTQKPDKPWTGHIRFSRSLDGGNSFSEPVTINDDRRTIAHRFPAMVINDNGELFLVWVDKRDQQNAKDAGQDYVGAALYYTHSKDHGASFARNLRLAAHSCECCRLAMSIDEHGLPVILYRQVFTGGIRDHALIRFQDASTPQPVERASDDQWQLNGCPHHGPALAMDVNLRHQLWFTAGKKRQGLFYQRSDDAPIKLGGAAAAHGQVAVLGDTVALVWKDLDDGDRSVIRLKLSRDGGAHWADVRTLLHTRNGSDHPLLISNCEQIFLAWRTDDEGNQLVAISGEHQ